MNIATVGQKKYDYQDLVCVLLALQFSDLEQAYFRIEPAQGEDAELHFLKDPTSAASLVHIQIKGAEVQFNLNTLTGWLLHFPAHQHTNSLLEQLVSGNASVLIVAWARCADDAARYALPANVISIESHAASTIRFSDAEAFLRALKQRCLAMPEGTALEKNRKQSVDDFLSTLTTGQLRAALQNLLVIERLDETTAREASRRLLLDKFDIAIDQISLLLSRLIDVIKSQKDSINNAMPLISQALQAYRANPLLPSGYVIRGDEDVFKGQLARDRALLISGAPRMGKTTLIRRIAADYVRLGFQLRETSDIDEAVRFLQDPVNADRLVILDDPLGSAHDSQNADSIYGRIDRLIPMLPSKRRLLIAQRQDRLLQVTRKASLPEVRTGRLKWEDLSAVTKSFSIDLWRYCVDRFNVPSHIDDAVTKAIEKQRLLLEPGCLFYLAATYQDVKDFSDIAAVIRHARQESIELGRAFEYDGMRLITMAIAVGTDSIVSVPRRELAFISGSGGALLPGKVQLIGRDFSTEPQVEDEDGADAYRYSEEPSLTHETLAALQKLELRRIIALRDRKNYLFTHPFYRAAAESLYDSATETFEDQAVEMLKRALLCLSPQTTAAAAKNLDWVYAQLGEAGKEKVISCAEEGIHSIFPATRDICYVFLTTKLTAVSSRYQDRLSEWVEAVRTIRLADMSWVDGQPQIRAFEGLGTLYGLFDDPIPFDEKIKASVDALNDANAPAPLPQQATAAIRYFHQHPEKLGKYAALRLLSYDVALIRAETANIWLSLDRDKDDIVSDKIFEEQHPKIASDAIDAILEKWPNFSAARQKRLVDGMLQLLTSPGAAVACIQHFLYHFTEERIEDPAQWRAFGAMLPVFFDNLPREVFISEDRLYSGVEQAIEHIELDSAMQLLRAWIALLERSAKFELQSDYMLGVSTLLIRATQDQPSKREGIVAQLLAVHGTGAKLRIVADLVDEWEHLTQPEKNIVQKFLREDRLDAKWLRGAAITRTVIPREIEEKFSPPGFLLSQSSPADILSHMNTEQLIAAVQIFIGEPHPLWSLGAHHAGKAIWGPVVEEIAKRPDQLLFIQVWADITMRYSGEKLGALVSALGTAHLQTIFDRLLENAERNDMPEAWEALFALADDEEQKKEWLKKMANIAHRVSDDLNNIDRWVPENYRNEFMELLVDSTYFLILERLYGSHLEESQQTQEIEMFSELGASLRKTYVESLALLLKTKAPQLIRTYDKIKYVVEKTELGTQEFFSDLDAARQKQIRWRSNLIPLPSQKIDSWID